MKNIVIYAVVFFVLLSFCGCGAQGQERVRILQDQSLLNRFYEENGTVHMLCTIKVENETKEAVEVTITAFSREDMIGGLLEDARMPGFNPERGDGYFTIPADSVTELLVDFRGTFGGKAQKADRLVPDVLELSVVSVLP